MKKTEQGNLKIAMPYSLNRKLKTYTGSIDWLTGFEISPLTNEQRLQRKQHLHDLPATLDELFERFLLPALECETYYKDYDFWSETWRIQWAYHKQNYRREAILNGVTQQQYAQEHKLPKRMMYDNLHKWVVQQFACCFGFIIVDSSTSNKRSLFRNILLSISFLNVQRFASYHDIP